MNRLRQLYDRFYWLAVVLIAVVLLNLAAGLFHGKIDLTEDKKYTLTEATKTIINEVDAPMFIQILLEGKFPAEFRRLPTATRELLEEFKKINHEIQFRFEDPLEGDKTEVKERLESWAQVGIVPTELNVRASEGQSRQRIYPFAIFNYGDRQVAINLLEETSGTTSGDVALNNSITLLEYKFANAIAKLRATDKPNILFSAGHGELAAQQSASLEGNLRAFYNTGRVNLDSIYQIPEEIDMLILAKPTIPYSEKNLFVIDQYIMRGGRLIILNDPLIVNLDSIRKNGQYLPHDNEVGLDDLLFKYGVRINKNFVLDLNCTPIPLAISKPGANAQYNLFPWYYDILASGFGDHPIVKGLDLVNLDFPASIDTIKTKASIKKTPLLKSSIYSRLQYNPVLLDFEILKTDPDQSKFRDPPQTVAILLEGAFNSVYENRVSPSMMQGLDQIGATFQANGIPAKILVVSDGDIARNSINATNGEIRPLGFNSYVNHTFANLEFLTNAIEFMLDRIGLSEARAKTIKLRLLDKQRIQNERLYWQVLNVVLPLVLLVAFGILFNALRRRRFAR
jgi:ABC-2 type transport system permease protein